MTSKLHIPLKASVITFAAIMSLSLLGCNSQQPQQAQPLTAEEQKKMEQDYQKTMDQMKQLTTGYGKEMQHVPPNVPTEPISHSHKATQGGKTVPQSPPQFHSTIGRNMKHILLTIALLAGTTAAAHAQFGSGIVYDPTQGTHAIQQIRQAGQLYTTATQTRDIVVSTYNLAHQLSTAPQQLYQRSATPWTNWNAVTAVNTYGNTPDWIQAVNTGLAVARGFESVTLGQAPRYPQYGNLNLQSQQIVAAQGATSDLSSGVTQSNLQTLGTMRANSQQRAADIQKLESQTYSTDPAQQTYMATLQRINQALLMQLRSQQDANQIAQAVALQQIVAQKQQQDALNAALQDAATYQQQYNATVAPLLSGFGETLRQTH